MRIGVLALQGGFAEHITALKKLNIDTFEIRKKRVHQYFLDKITSREAGV